MDRLKSLKKAVEKTPIAIVRLDDQESEALCEFSRLTFSIARPHDDLSAMGSPRLCAILTDDLAPTSTHLAVSGRSRAIVTTESRLHFKRIAKVTPPISTAAQQLAPKHKRVLTQRLADASPVTLLSPKLSSALIDLWANNPANDAALRSIEAGIDPNKTIQTNADIQQNAIYTALRTFGLTGDPPPAVLYLNPDKQTALATLPLMEDTVIQHDSRSIDGFRLTASTLTGRAIFHRGNQKLEVITANRLDLEEIFGVDLIYINHTHHNVVMVQYKMLNRLKSGDWIYRPDGQLEEELNRMRVFANAKLPCATGYRFNKSTFYLKFVKRDGAITKSGIILPLDHYDAHVNDPANKGPKGGLKISFNALEGAYMRESPFIDLISAGYIGSHVETTEALKPLIDAIISGNRAVVAAIQTAAPTQPSEEATDDDDDDFED